MMILFFMHLSQYPEYFTKKVFGMLIYLLQTKLLNFHVHKWHNKNLSLQTLSAENYFPPITQRRGIP